MPTGLGPRRAFTLPELVVVVMIVGILAAGAGVRVGNSLQRHRVEAAAKRVRADLLLARQRAIAESTTHAAEFDSATESYTLPGIVDPDRSGRTYVVDLAAAYVAEIVSTSLSGNDVAFDRFGRPDAGGTITLRAGSFQQTVTIDPDSGRVSIP